MMFSRYVCIRAVCCVVLFMAARAARAESQFGFDLDYCCEQATTIVLGQFTAEDEFEVKEFLLGGKPESKTLPIAVEYTAALRAAFDVNKKAKIEALVFLDKDGKPVLRESSLVGFRERDVAIVDYSLQHGLAEERLRLALHPKLTRDDVLSATRQLLGLVAQRRELLAQPPSRERITRLLNMLREDLKNRCESKLPGERADFQVAKVADGLRPMNRAEESSVIQAMCGPPSATQEWRIRLLKLSEFVPLSGNGFEAVANWIGPDNPYELRVASIQAMARVNHLWASDRLIPLLSLDDECLPEISYALCTGSGSADFWLHNRRVVDALGALVKDILKRDEPLNRKWPLRLQPVLTAISRNFHPRLLPELIEWSTRIDDPSAVEAAVTLRSLLGFDRSANDLEPILAWWKTARGALEQDYDLSRAEGVADWLSAYEKADERTRRALDVLWLFEPRANESYLLQEAKSDKAERAATAKVALRTLWTMDLLSAYARGRIADEFLTVELIEVPAVNAGSHELRMVLHRKFPLPKRLYLESSVGFSNDGSAPILKDGWSSRDAVGEGEIVLGSLGGGSIGEHNSRYVFSVREFDHRKHEVLWTRRWDFGQKDAHKGLARE